MQKFRTPCIKTGEFARLCNTNKRTLFHYDQIGLFSPALTDEKGYRFYSESQCDVFFTITCLREIGMPLKEIKSYLDQKDPQSLKQLLLQQQEKVRLEQRRLRRIQQVIETKLALVDQGEALLRSPPPQPVVLEDMPEEFMVLSPRLDTSDHNTLIRALCDHIGYCTHHDLNAGHPYGAMISTKALEQGQWDTYAYFMTKVLDEPLGHPFHRKPAGRYAVIYLKGDYYNSGQAYQTLLSYFQDHHLTPGAYSYKEAVLDELSSARMADYLTRISIQILP